jgi:hypothetical protein
LLQSNVDIGAFSASLEIKTWATKDASLGCYWCRKNDWLAVIHRKLNIM